MKRAFPSLILLALLVGCSTAGKPNLNAPSTAPFEAKAPRNSVRVIHVFVALCDNVNQGIVPVSPSLGNGDNPATNLYWGAAFGVKTFFSRSKDWQAVTASGLSGKAGSVVLDRVVFRHRNSGTFLVAEAYRGRFIRQATEDFLAAAAGATGEKISLSIDGKSIEINGGGSANMLVYIGHNGLMDFQLSALPRKHDDERRDAMVLACASQSYFADALRAAGAKPLLWTTNLMAPEAYVLAAALDGWLNHESDEQVRMRAATAYSAYQRTGLRGASALFATGR